MCRGERGTFAVFRGRRPRFALDCTLDEQRSFARAALMRLPAHAESSASRAFVPFLLALHAHAFQAPCSVVALLLLVFLTTALRTPTGAGECTAPEVEDRKTGLDGWPP